jgi:hypothetical protein
MNEVQVYDGDGTIPLVDFTTIEPMRGGQQVKVLFFNDDDSIKRAYGLATVRKLEHTLSLVIGSRLLPANEELGKRLTSLHGSFERFNLEILGVRYVDCLVANLIFNPKTEYSYIQVRFARTIQRD